MTIGNTRVDKIVTVKFDRTWSGVQPSNTDFHHLLESKTDYVTYEGSKRDIDRSERRVSLTSLMICRFWRRPGSLARTVHGL